MKPKASLMKRGVLLSFFMFGLFYSSNTSFEHISLEEHVKASPDHDARERFCKVTPYSKSRLYKIPNVQKSISRWKVKRAYSGEESKVPFRKRNSLKICSANSTDYSMSKLRESMHAHSRQILKQLSYNEKVEVSPVATPGTSLLVQSSNFCAKPISFAFAISSQEGSGKIRGFMIADELNKLGHTAVTVFGKEGPLWPDPLKELRTCSTLHLCIFVKWDSRSFPRILLECKKRGALAFIDLLDYCDSNRKNIVDQWPKEIDGFILQSKFQFQVFQSVGFSNSVVIRHHHTNIKSEKLALRSENHAVKTIGFTGSRKNSGGIIQNFLGDIEIWASKRNIKIVQIVSNRIIAGKTKISDIYDQNKYHTGVIESVDVAIVWPKDFSNSEIYFKPITRFIHWLSHGIPTIVYPTQSYIEIAEEFGYPLLAKNTTEVLEWLEVLVSNKSFRSQISHLGLVMAEKFSLKNTVQQYSNAFCGMHD